MEMLDKTIKRYTNQSVEAAQVNEELIELARKVREEKSRGKLRMVHLDFATLNLATYSDTALGYD